ncbi:TerC family protein [Bombella mellum]|uniref:Uncharacterized protein n=1 Tax=Bombella mellum TaxID=2039288 RepID=A0ABR5ZRC0_9PROT|nr:hypothetical protein [Bombella mellum]MBA5726872.1 hypothetical protein [Bombella mellum]
MSFSHFILMVFLTILLNLALSGYNVVILKKIIDSIRPTRLDEDFHSPLAKVELRRYRRQALMFGTALAAFLRIGLTLILSDLLIFSYTKIVAGVLLLWTSWSLFRALTSPDPDEESSHSTSLAEAIPKIIIADLALGLDNILAIACLSIYHHVILIIGLVMSILIITLGVMHTPTLLLRMRWLGWFGFVIMIGLSIHLFFLGYHEILFPHAS